MSLISESDWDYMSVLCNRGCPETTKRQKQLIIVQPEGCLCTICIFMTLKYHGQTCVQSKNCVLYIFGVHIMMLRAYFVNDKNMLLLKELKYVAPSTETYFFIKFDHLIGTVFIQSELNCSIGVSSRGNLAALSSMNSLHNSCLDISRMVSESEKRAANSNSLISPPVTPVSLETDGFVPLVLPVVTKVGA